MSPPSASCRVPLPRVCGHICLSFFSFFSSVCHNRPPSPERRTLRRSFALLLLLDFLSPRLDLFFLSPPLYLIPHLTSLLTRSLTVPRPLRHHHRPRSRAPCGRSPFFALVAAAILFLLWVLPCVFCCSSRSRRGCGARLRYRARNTSPHHPRPRCDRPPFFSSFRVLHVYCCVPGVPHALPNLAVSSCLSSLLREAEPRISCRGHRRVRLTHAHTHTYIHTHSYISTGEQGTARCEHA